MKLKSLIKNLTVTIFIFVLMFVFCACNGATEESLIETSAEENVITAEKWLLSKMSRNDGTWTEEYHYDEKGLLAYTETETVFGDSKTYYTYDEDGRTTVIKSVADSSTTTQTFAYDERGNLTEHKTEIKDIQAGNSEAYILYTYDADGRILTESYSNGAVSTYTYNPDGNYTMEKVRADGVLIISESYGADGLALTWKSSNGSGKYEYSFDEKGNILGFCNISDNGETEEIIECIYDEEGNCISEKKTYSEEFMNSHLVYEYDSYGNKLRTYKVQDGTKNLVEECEYTLFTVTE